MNELNELDVLDTPYTPPTYEIWGQCFFAVWKAAYQKGKGKVSFDPNLHSSAVNAIDISVVPIEQQKAKIAERKTAQNEKEWGLIQTSITALGKKPSDIGNQFVRIKFEPTGETYTNSAGESKNKTYMKFIKVFADENECLVDYMEARGSELGTQEDGNEPAEPTPEVIPAAATKMFESMVRGAAKGKTTLEEVKAAVKPRLDGSPAVNKYYSLEHPEFDRLAKVALEENRTA